MLILHSLAKIQLYTIDAKPGDYRVIRITRHIAMHYPKKLIG